MSISFEETKTYELKVGLFIHEYNSHTNSSLWGIGVLLLPTSVVMYDYYHEEFGHIFRLLDDKYNNHFVIVPEGYEDEMMKEFVQTDNVSTPTNTSNMYLSSIKYGPPVEYDNNESVTLVGNNKVWN